MWRSPTTPTRSSPSPPVLTEISLIEQKAQPSISRNSPLSPRSTLAEALKNNPFKVNGHGIKPAEVDAVTLLNHDLRVFALVYPDVKIEVLRELLSRFDGDSRLHISVEQLVRYKNEWARGRLINPPRGVSDEIPQEELFRTKSYVAASRQVLCNEFKSLNKSAIDAVLAEVNQSYTKARPVLQEIAAKSWRATFTSLFKRKRAADEVPQILIEKQLSEPVLHRTGDKELDRELEELFLTSQRQQRRARQERKDLEFATNLNRQEAEEAGALFECQVCYDDVPFEAIVTCTANTHVICHSCVKHSLDEAVFGQGWAKTIDVQHSTLRCVSPAAQEECTGHIPSELLRLTVVSADAGRETWKKFEQRCAADSIIKSGLPLKQCAFCHYAETPQVFTPSTASSIQWRVRHHPVDATLVWMTILAEFLLPSLLLLIAFVSIISPGWPRKLFNTSIINLHERVQTHRFTCKNPACQRTSCLSCSKAWHDPHTCHEPLIISLRTAVEAARTSALKRTCPRCGTSFVKSSGCNKLVCICGYAMCYVCRKNIGKVNANGSVDEGFGGEGYRHFCEHFRPNPGQKCTECDKCDLYKSENEELIIKKAGEEAEKAWREREGMVGTNSLGLEEAVGSMGKLGKDDVFTAAWEKVVTGKWTLQGACDSIVGWLIIIED